jgi:hypothetical protein
VIILHEELGLRRRASRGRTVTNQRVGYLRSAPLITTYVNMFNLGVCPLNLFDPSSDIILLCLPYVHDTSTWRWRVDLMITRTDTALGDILFALVPLVHLPLSCRRILLVVSPPVYREPPGVSAVKT